MFQPALPKHMQTSYIQQVAKKKKRNVFWLPCTVVHCLYARPYTCTVWVHRGRSSSRRHRCGMTWRDGELKVSGHRAPSCRLTGSALTRPSTGPPAAPALGLYIYIYMMINKLASEGRIVYALVIKVLIRSCDGDGHLPGTGGGAATTDSLCRSPRPG